MLDNTDYYLKRTQLTAYHAYGILNQNTNAIH